MPFRFRRSIPILPGVRINIGNRGITSITIGRTNFRPGYTPKTTIRLFRGLSWFFGGKRSRQ